MICEVTVLLLNAPLIIKKNCIRPEKSFVPIPPHMFYHPCLIENKGGGGRNENIRKQ